MNKCALVLGAVAIATLAGCKDPDYKYGNEQTAQNQVKPVEATPATPAPTAQPIAIETVPAAKCTCLPGTKHVSPCMCGAPDCRCVVVPQKVIVADVKPAPGAAAAATTTYIVQRGDSLSKISKKYNIRVDAIRKANPKIKNDIVRVGQKLTLPGKVDVGVQTVPAGAIAKPVKAAKKPYAPYAGTTKEYVVKNGDTLGAIAYANGISIRQLKELNGLSSNALRIGQKLKIPAAGKAAKTAKAAAKAKEAPKAPVEPAKTEAAPKAAPADAAPTANAPAPADAAPAAPAAAPAADAAPAVGVPPAAEAAPAAPAAKLPETTTTTYVVQDGDDMTGISIRYAVSAARIRELNNLGDDAQLLPGQILKIPVENQQ